MTPPVTSITTSHNLPPLPQNLSTKLLKTINPQTGNCIHHPKVQLCELIQNNTRWVVRRKICYKCGSRPISTGGVGSRHRPGVSVVNPSSRKFDNLDDSGRERGRMRRSRSMSIDRTSGRRSRSVSIDRINGSSSSERRRSTSSALSHHHNNNASATSNMSRRSRSHSLSSRQRSIANTTFSRQDSQHSKRSKSQHSQHSRQRSHSVTSHLSSRSRSTSSNNNRQRRHSEVLNESVPLLTNIAQSNINSIMSMSPSSRELNKSSRELVKNEREGSRSSRNLERGSSDKEGKGHRKQNSSSHNINSPPPNKDEQQHSPLEKYNPPVSTIGGNHTNVIEPASVCGGTITGGIGDTNRVIVSTHDNKKRHSYHGNKALRDDEGSTPKEKVSGGLVYPHTAPEPANNYTEEKKTRGSNKRTSHKEKKKDSDTLGPLTIPDLAYKDDDHQDDDRIEPSNHQHTQSINNFNESDPIISIPQINLTSSEMPPPPPRTMEEMEHHQARLEMRRQSIRKQREINRKKRDGIVKRIKNGEADIDIDGKGKDGNRKGDKKSDVVGTKDERQDKRQGMDRGRSARWDRQERLVTATTATSNIDRSGRSGRSSRSRDPPQERLAPPSSTSSRRRSSSVNMKKSTTGRRRSSSVDVRQKRTSKGEEAHPSATALALLTSSSSKPERRRSRSSFDIRDKRGSGGDPPPQETLIKERRQSTKINKPSTRGDDVHPSAAAMALLEKSNNKKKSSPELCRRSTTKTKEQQATNEDEDNSETSSISSASAKDYPTNEHVRQHPELEGVELPHIPVSRRSSSKPPADVTVDRSQSNSRSKSRSREDPPDNLKKQGTSSRRVSSSRALVTTSLQGEKDKKHDTKRASLRVTSSTKQMSSRSNTSRRRRSHDDHEDFEDHVTTTDMNKTTSDLTKSLSAALAASSSRKARRRASSKSMSTSGKVWDEGNEVISKDRPRLNRSVSASCQGRYEKDDASPKMDSNKDAKKKKQRSRSVTNPTTKERSGDKSHSTKSTVPESLSSQELFTKRQSDEGEDDNEYVVTPTSIQEDKDTEPEQPMVIYKKRAKKRKDDEDGAQHTKPIGVLYCSSSDEKSAASSISNTSTIEESYASTVDYGGRSSTNKGDNGDEKNVKDRAKAALHDVKGGAKQFATKGREALGGLKGTSRKWQSALFM